MKSCRCNTDGLWGNLAKNFRAEFNVMLLKNLRLMDLKMFEVVGNIEASIREASSFLEN